MPQKPVTLVQKSQNKKLSTNGQVHATYASQSTCPESCPFYNKGCYAEIGDTGYTTRRLNDAKQKNPIRISRIEAELIKKSDGKFPLRLHVVGDCKNRKSASILAEAASEYIKKQGQAVWTYTHNRLIPRECWGEISVLRSCTTIRQAETAVNAGFAAALIVSEFKTHKRHYIGRGLYGIPCPKQTERSKSCVDCKLCFNDKWLQKSKIVILFEAHGNGRKHVIEFLNSGGCNKRINSKN